MNRLRIAAGRLLLVALATWALAMIVPDLYRVFNPLASFGIVVDNDGLVVDVAGPFTTAADSPAVIAGIKPDDRIDLQAMRCIPLDAPRCRSVIAVLGGLAGTQIVLPDRVIDLVIQPAGGGASRLVRLKAARAPSRWADRLVLLADSVVGIAVVLTAFLLVWTRPGQMTWGFFLYAIWFNPGQTFVYYAMLTSPVAVVVQGICEALAQGAGYAGLLVFALCFPAGAIEPQWRRFRWVAPLLAAVMAVLLLGSYASVFGIPAETVASAAFLAGFVIDAAVLLILLRRRRTLPPQDRQRMVWVIWGCAIGLPSFIFAEIAQSTSLSRHVLHLTLSQPVIGLLYLLNGVLTYFVSEAVWRKRVVSVYIPLRRGTILTALALAVGVPIVTLHEMLAHYQESLQLPEWVWALVVAPVALLVLHRLHRIGVKLVDHVLNRRFYAARLQLTRAGLAMERAHSAAEIDQLLVDAPMKALTLSSSAVFRKEGTTFRLREHSTGWNASALRELRPREDAAVMRSLDVGAPVRLPREGWDRHGLTAELEAPCLVVPVCSDALQAIALVLYGPHEDGNDIDQDECEMLGELAAHATAGYDRVEFFRLHQEVTELRARLASLIPT